MCFCKSMACSKKLSVKTIISQSATLHKAVRVHAVAHRVQQRASHPTKPELQGVGTELGSSGIALHILTLAPSLQPEGYFLKCAVS